MKKNLILLYILIFSTFNCLADIYFPDNVTFIPHMYGLRISSNGKYIANYAGYAKIYDIEKDEMTEYSNFSLSLGNCISNNGIIACGNALMKDGKIYNTGGFSVNAINSEGTKVTGSWRRGPAVADLDENMNVINIVQLPYPSTDLMQTRPQWITSMWISEDGKTTAGQVMDGYGAFCYPIMYKETPDGWKYSIPIEDMFNPEGLEILANPSLNQPHKPSPEEYMSEAQKTLYQQALQAYNSGTGMWPDPRLFMTEEAYSQYVAAAEAYNEWFYANVEAFNRYLDNYYAILSSTPTFNQHELALSPSGEYLYMNGGTVDQYGNTDARMYKFTFDGVEEVIPLVDNSQYPDQVLSDGTLLTSIPKFYIPTCYMLLPGEDSFITLPEFLGEEYPELAHWLITSFPGGTGVVSMSDDKTVIVGAVTPLQVNDEMYDAADYNSASYIINLDPAGVESILSEMGDGVLRVYNLQGLKVMETTQPESLFSLKKGIYIVNGHKIAF